MFSQSNNEFRVVASGINIVEELPPAIYNLTTDHFGNFIINRSDEQYILPKKIYGDALPKADRILDTWKSRPTKNTGVLLSGDKGSGKSMLAQVVAAKFIQNGGIVISVTTNYTGTAFEELLSSITQPCIIMMDEFEKTYDGRDQEKMLSTMDGALTRGKLFLLTVNNIWKIDENMINRPGRIFYHYRYGSLPAEFIREYCEDKLKNKENIEGICQLSVIFEKFNFDMLQAIVEELNRYGETLAAVMEHLNIQANTYRSRGGDNVEYVVRVFKGEEEITQHYEDATCTSPLTSNNNVELYPRNRDEDETEYHDMIDLYLKPNQLVSMDKEGSMTFYDEGEKLTLKLTRKKEKPFSYMSLVS